MPDRTFRVLVLLAAGALSAIGQDAPKRINHADAVGAVVSKVAPEYPPMAKQLRIVGTVEVDVTILENGTVDSVKAVSGNPILTRAATHAVAKWKFKPFTDNGTPVKAIATLSFEFKP